MHIQIHTLTYTCPPTPTLSQPSLSAASFLKNKKLWSLCWLSCNCPCTIVGNTSSDMWLSSKYSLLSSEKMFGIVWLDCVLVLINLQDNVCVWSSLQPLSGTTWMVEKSMVPVCTHSWQCFARPPTKLNFPLEIIFRPKQFFTKCLLHSPFFLSMSRLQP